MTECRQPDNAECGYKCSRCGGVFDSAAPGDAGAASTGGVVQCPFCGNLCDAVSCRLTVFSNQEY